MVYSHILQPLPGIFKKIGISFPTWWLYSTIPVDNAYTKYIYLPMYSVNAMSILKFNDFSMSDWSRFQ